MDLYKSGRQFISKMWSPPAIKYHGLENQGSTCYLNSVLQVLFMTKDFREAVEGYTSDNPDSEHIDLQLKSLFGDLKSYPAYTHKITKKLGINNVYEQQDAAEYFEKILAKTSDDASKIFHGQLTHKTTCSSCDTETDAARPFWHLPLALENSYSRNYSVVNGIEKYFRENWMHCKKCDDKSDATSKCVINHHPEVLMLLLKRFEFDNRSMRYVKNNCTVDVPCTLQIPENQPYELYAMVEHSGDLRSGHYIAKIKSEDDGRWYSFNDRWVTELPSQPFQSDQVEKSSSAYLLFYRKEKAIKYHGLENQGSTCYLNSVLQVLFMTKDFREAVEGYTSDNPDSEHIDLQLESLFGDLKSYPAYTHKITKKLGITNVYEQQDAAEYFEKILAKTSDDASKIFHGQLTHKTTCSSCGTETDAAGPFWNLPLALEDSYSRNYSVVNGIEKYFRESSLNGENQMYCEKCDDKSAATTKCVINHHPEVLMLLLKRFEFDYYSMRYIKINCTVDVPCTLQIPENQPYELYAMVEHSGDLRSGHYIATIKSEDDGRCYSFNDSCVTLANYQPFQLDQVEKSDSAYLLFYRKKKVHAADTHDTREKSTQCQDEVEKTAGAGCTNAVDVSIDNNLETGVRNYVNDECKRSSDLSSSEDRPIGGYNNPNIQQECNDEGKDMRYHLQDDDAEKQRDEREMIASDEEAMTGIAEAENQTKKTEILPRETEESVDDQGKDSARPDDVSHRKSQEGDDIHNTSCRDYKQGVSNMHPQHVDMQKDEEQMAVEGHEDGWIKDDAQSERRGIDFPNRFPKHQYYEELYYVKQQDMYKDEMGTQEVEGKDVPKPVIIRYYNEDKERKSGTRKLLTKYDLCYGRVGDSKQSKSKISRLYKSPEQQREEMDVKGDMEQKRGGDKQAQRRETSERHQHSGQDRDDHIYRRSDAGQSSSEHFAQTTQTDAHVTETHDGDRMEGRFDSEKALHLHERIPAEEIRKTHGGDEKRSERRNMIDAGEGTSHTRVSVEYDRAHSESLSGPKTDAKVTLPEKVSKLNLKDLPSPKPQGTKGMSVAQEQDVGIKYAKKIKSVKKIKLWRSSSPLKQKGSKKKKRTSGCFSFFRKGRKNADQTSESD